MQNIMEKGRSMVEMLGVLAIIGVLSIGGLNVFNRMQSSRKSTQLMTDFFEFVTKAKKMSCQFDDGYTDATVFLYKNNAYPKNWEFDGVNKFIGILNTTYDVFYNKDSSSGVMTKFRVVITGLSDSDCMNLVTSDAASRKSSFGFVSMKVKNRTVYEALNLDNASKACDKGSNGNSVEMTFKGCM